MTLASEGPDRRNERQNTVSGGIWVAASRFIPLVGTAVLSVSIGRLLGPHLLGVNSYIAYVQGLFATFAFGVITGLSIRLMAQALGAADEARFGRLERLSFRANVGFGVMSAVALASIGWSRPERVLWILAGITVLVDGWAWGYGASVIAKRGWGASARLRLITQSASVALGLAGLLAGLGLEGVFAGSLLGSIGLLILFRSARGPRSTTGASTSLPPGTARLAWSFALLVLVGQVVDGRVEFLFLERFSTAVELSMYSIGFMLISVATLLPASFITSGLPLVARAYGAGRLAVASEALTHATRVSFAFGIPLAGVTSALGPLAIVTVYGDDFRGAAALVPLMSVGIILGIPGRLCSSFWSGANRLRIPIGAGLAGSVVDVALCFLLIPGWGAWGAAAANLAGSVTLSLTVLAATRATIGTRGLLNGVSIRLLVVWPVVAGLAWWALRPFWEWPAWGQVTALLVGAGALFGVGVLLARTVGLVAVQDAVWLRESMPPKLAPALRIVMPPSSGGSASER